jgi:hypothetical protein
MRLMGEQIHGQLLGGLLRDERLLKLLWHGRGRGPNSDPWLLNRLRK